MARDSLRFASLLTSRDSLAGGVNRIRFLTLFVNRLGTFSFCPCRSVPTPARCGAKRAGVHHLPFGSRLYLATNVSLHQLLRSENERKHYCLQ